MLKRILSVIISSIILAIGFSLINYIPEEQKEPNIYYMGISENFIFTLYFSLVFYTVIGLPVSWLIDKYRKRYNHKNGTKRYLIGMALYSLAGIISGAIIYSTVGFIRFFLDIFLETVALGFVASLLYFHILCLLEKNLFKNTRIKREKPRNYARK